MLVNAGTGLAMDANGGSAADGAAIIAWYGNGNSNQDFAADRLG